MPIPLAVPIAVAAGSALANLIGNGIQSANEESRRSEARQRLQSAQSHTDSQYAAMLNDITNYYANRGGIGTAQDVSDYRSAIQGYSPDSFVYSPDKTFDETWSMSRDDFLNPYMQQIVGDTANQVQHTAAGAGLGRGSGAAQAIAQAVAEKNNELYKEAQQEYKDERNFQYNKYNDYIAQKQRELDTKRSALENKISMTGNLANDYFNVMDSQQSDLLKARQDRIGTGVTYSTAMAGLY